MTKPPDNRTTRRPLARWMVCAVAHSVGIAAVGVLLWVPYLNSASLELMWQSAQHQAYLEMTWLEALFHVALSGCLWTLVVLGFEIVTARRAPATKLLRLERGSVMTETLVILPIFLLLTFGIAQLAVNNMAGLLTNTAVFQAGRTAWLWQSEADAGRFNGNVEELARVQAAAVLTPVAPAEFMQKLGGLSEPAEQMRGILLGSQIPPLSQDSGQNAMSLAPWLMAGENLTHISGKNSTFNRAFDTSGFRQRTVRKFTFAYHATEIHVREAGDRVVTDLTYYHHQAFPMVGPLFGEPNTGINGRAGYYSPIQRQFSMQKQIEPNPVVP